MCGQSLVYFGSSVIYTNGVHIYNRQNYYCGGEAQKVLRKGQIIVGIIFGSCFSTLRMRGQSCSCLFWCLQLILFSFAPIYGSFVALVFGGVSPVQLVFSVCCDCRWILVSICEYATSLQSTLDHRLLFISMEFISQPSKLLLCGGR